MGARQAVVDLYELSLDAEFEQRIVLCVEDSLISGASGVPDEQRVADEGGLGRATGVRPGTSSLACPWSQGG